MRCTPRQHIRLKMRTSFDGHTAALHTHAHRTAHTHLYIHMYICTTLNKKEQRLIERKQTNKSTAFDKITKEKNKNEFNRNVESNNTRHLFACVRVFVSELPKTKYHTMTQNICLEFTLPFADFTFDACNSVVLSSTLNRKKSSMLRRFFVRTNERLLFFSACRDTQHKHGYWCRCPDSVDLVYSRLNLHGTRTHTNALPNGETFAKVLYFGTSSQIVPHNVLHTSFVIASLIWCAFLLLAVCLSLLTSVGCFALGWTGGLTTTNCCGLIFSVKSN